MSVCRVLQLEMDILKIKSNLESRSTAQIPTSHLSKTMPVTEDEFLRQVDNTRAIEMIQDLITDQSTADVYLKVCREPFILN